MKLRTRGNIHTQFSKPCCPPFVSGGHAGASGHCYTVISNIGASMEMRIPPDTQHMRQTISMPANHRPCAVLPLRCEIYHPCTMLGITKSGLVIHNKCVFITPALCCPSGVLPQLDFFGKSGAGVNQTVHNTSHSEDTSNDGASRCHKMVPAPQRTHALDD